VDDDGLGEKLDGHGGCPQCPVSGGLFLFLTFAEQLSLLKTLNVGETPGFLWLSEF